VGEQDILAMLVKPIDDIAAALARRSRKLLYGLGSQTASDRSANGEGKPAQMFDEVCRLAG
jgi:hypothetical protein